MKSTMQGRELLVRDILRAAQRVHASSVRRCLVTATAPVASATSGGRHDVPVGGCEKKF